MRKTLFGCICFLLITTFFYFSCSKDNATPRTDLLTAHPWKLKTLIATPGLRRTSRDTAFSDNSPEDPCDVDNTFQFYKDGTAAIHSGTIHCSNNEVSSLTGAWHFVNDGEKLWFHLKGMIGGGYGYTFDTVYTIKELSADRLKLSSEFYWSWTNKIHTEEIVFVK